METIVKSLIVKDVKRTFIPTHTYEGSSMMWEPVNPNRSNWVADTFWMSFISRLVEISDGIILAYWDEENDIKRYGTYSIYKGTLIC